MRTRDLEKQKRIKEAMVQLFLREGMSSASIAKIAKEAGVSPATIYIYYDSKEAMMAEVFHEYSQRSYGYMMHCVRPEMTGRELIDAIVRGYYSFSREYEDVFSFVEQCSLCPTLSQVVSLKECCCDIMDLFHRYQRQGIMKDISESVLGAVLFAPVKQLAHDHKSPASKQQKELDELIGLLQDLLVR